MNLVVVESPSKAKTIKKYLGKGYEVIASKGHVIDLPKSDIGVDVEHNFKPNYVVTKKDSLKKLKDAYKDADKLILAVDMDREGEAIGWHIAQKLGALDSKNKIKAGNKLERIVFHEISKKAIEEAINSPRDLNMDLVNSQQARRILDRLVGYKLSPLLWKKISFGLSAGRVQSAAVRLVVEKEIEREAFDAKEYWSIDSLLHEEKKSKIEINFVNIEKEVSEEEEEISFKDKEGIKFALVELKGKKAELSNKTSSEAVVGKIKDAKWIIDSVTKSNQARNAKPPFITSTLQQAAVNTLGFSAKRTMTIAQKLYENGHITYMRTDSVTMSDEAIAKTRKFVQSKYGPKYLPEKPVVYKTKSKNAQEAHECIRPVNVELTADAIGLDSDEKKIYDLIRNRAMASQMSSALFETLQVDIVIDEYRFRANGSRVLFDGFLKVLREKQAENILPELKKGQELYASDILCKQHFTKPPARFSEATLIKKLEELGIGRPSTYASIISTILSRKYVEKEGRYLKPTDTGRVVNKLLTKYFFNVVDYAFTAEMEDELDKVADGKLDWVTMLSDFYFPFEKTVKEKEKDIPRDEFTVLGDAPDDVKCPECGSKMIIKLGRYGRFYSCTKFPECKGMLSMDLQSKEDIEKEAQSDEFKNDYEDAPKTEDGKDYVLKAGKFGKFWAHPDYPKVKDAKPLVMKPEKLRATFGEPPKTEDGKDYLLKSGKFGFFWAHPDYPKVKDIKRIAKKK